MLVTVGGWLARNYDMVVDRVERRPTVKKFGRKNCDNKAEDDDGRDYHDDLKTGSDEAM